MLIKELNIYPKIFHLLDAKGLKSDNNDMFDLNDAKTILDSLNMDDHLIYKAKLLPTKKSPKIVNKRLIEQYRLALEEERLKLLNIKLRTGDKNWTLSHSSDLDLANKVNTTIIFLQNTFRSLPLDIHKVDKDELNERIELTFNKHIRANLKHTPLSIKHLEIMSNIYKDVLNGKNLDVVMDELNLIL
jgi:hypothetical protein